MFLTVSIHSKKCVYIQRNLGLCTNIYKYKNKYIYTYICF